MRIAYDHFASEVFRPTPTMTTSTKSAELLPTAGTAMAEGLAATAAARATAVTVAEAVRALATDAPPGGRAGEAARAETAAGMAAPTAAREAGEEALQVVATLGAAEPLARRAGAKRATANPRAEATGVTRTPARMKMAAATPRRTAGRMPAVEETLEGVATLGAAEPPARQDTDTPRGEAIGGIRAQALMELAAASSRRTAGVAPEAEGTLEGVATLGAAEPPARGDTATPRAEATEAIGDKRAETFTQPAASAFRRTTDRAPTSLS